jgi:hypothetical protein
MRNRTFGSTLATLAAIVLVGLGTTASTTAASAAADKQSRTRSVQQTGSVPGGFASWQELMSMQRRLVRAADRITAATRADGSGFAGIVAAPENRELQLFWKGDTPASVKALLSDVRQDVPVSVHRARYSESELAREGKRLAARSAGQITSIAAKVDGSGLTVTVANATASTSARSLVMDADVPVAVEANVAPALASRWNDSPPWYGGAAWGNATRGGGCSTGFPVWHAGRTKMLTAGHCGALGDRATDPTGERIGSVTEDNNTYDVALIDARSAGRVFNNTASLSEFTNPAIGTINSYPGLWICTSGAYSGTRCAIQVKQTGVAIWVGYWILNTVRAEQRDFTNAVGQGDSGGAVQVVASDPTKVYAAGVNTAIDTSTAVACTGYVTSGRTCAWRMYYAPWSSAAAVFGTSIVLG